MMIPNLRSILVNECVEYLSIVSGGMLGCTGEDGNCEQGTQFLSAAEFIG